MPCWPVMVATLTISSPSRMLRPKRLWNSIPHSRTRTQFWVSTKVNTTGNLSGCEAEFRKAFELDPSDATAHQRFSEMLSFIGGRAQEAIDEANRARQLDPLSPIIGNAQAGAYASVRQSDKAIENRQESHCR